MLQVNSDYYIYKFAKLSEYSIIVLIESTQVDFNQISIMLHILLKNSTFFEPINTLQVFT